jgi:histidinol-phosphate aminotransferase
MSVLDLARADLHHLSAYSSARMEASGGDLWLNANESPWPNAGVAAALNRYPEPQPVALIEALAALYQVSADRVFVGRGSDEPIDLLTRAFCRAGQDQVIVSPPTFGMYAMAARVQGAAVGALPLLAAHGFAYDFAGVRAAVTAATRLVYACTPNNPTGNSLPVADLLDLAEALRDRAVLVVDEAYIDYAEAPSLIAALPRFDHLVVLRTLSKAHGLAAARIGVALADPAVIDLLRRIMPPYPLPSPCVAAALQALSAPALAATRAHVQTICSEREQLAAALAARDDVCAVLPSQANFVTVRWRDAEAVYAHLQAHGILVRSLRRYPGLEDALRISVGSPPENRRLLATLAARMVAA